MLKKKTARKQLNNKPSKADESNSKAEKKTASKDLFDISKFKAKMTQELSFNAADDILSKSSRVSKTYEKQYTEYITETFRSSTLTLIHRMCQISKTLPNDLRNNYPIHSLLLKVTKELMLNDLELIYLSLYFDIFGWKCSYLDVLENFLILGLSVKKYLNSDTVILEDFLNKNYTDIINKFSIWFNKQKDFRDNITITPRQVNERYKEMMKVSNTYCKKNYIDYNESVDKILQMSLPYNESGKEDSKKKSFVVEKK